MTNEPKNHHFIPQHYLKAWQSTKGKIIRYRIIPETGAFEIKEVGIKKTASINDLYRITFPDGSFEIESSLITPEVDEQGHKIIEEARNSTITLWSKAQKKKLANYFTCLEARHPEIIDEMNIGADLDILRAEMKSKGHFKDTSIDEVINYFQSSDSIGVVNLASFIQNEIDSKLTQPFSEGLLKAHVREYKFDSAALLCSDYPTSRWGDYLKTFMLAVAISPTKSVIYSTNKDIDVFNQLPASSRAKLINLYSLAKAEVAYFKDQSMANFVKEHLGWAKQLNSNEKKQEYISNFVIAELMSKTNLA